MFLFLFNGLETCFLFLNDWWQINAFKIPCLYFLLKEIKVEQSKIGDNLCVCVKKSSHDLYIMNQNSLSSLSKKKSYEITKKFLHSYFDPLHDMILAQVYFNFKSSLTGTSKVVIYLIQIRKWLRKLEPIIWTIKTTLSKLLIRNVVSPHWMWI